MGWFVDKSDGYSLLLFDMDDIDTWAKCDREPKANDFLVVQNGKRRLWDELSSAYLQWLSLGSPTADRFGVTQPAGQTKLWIDHPGGPSRHISSWEDSGVGGFRMGW
ncbi:hypothetical protein [Nonomuraea sp. NPDC049695]|uniref:hypothetical protein n=1 Tax=Nonomuraea sp. NPDC049695 TaxID=3154734 RepID=UPI00342BBE80